MPFKIVRNDTTRVGGLGKLCISVHKGATGKTGCEIDKMNELASEKIYGIVFVEEV